MFLTYFLLFSLDAICAFWDENSRLWSTEGCTAFSFQYNNASQFNQSIVECHCTHLTNFTVMYNYGTSTPPGAKSTSSSDNKIKLIVPLVVCLSAAFIIGVILVAFFLSRRKLRKVKRRLTASESLVRQSALDFTEIKADGIEVQHRIGGGAFGDVYKGLYLGTTEVALKKLSKDADIREFEQEASMLQVYNF
jgi:hypothetical protein